jgi:hypothetical protein
MVHAASELSSHTRHPIKADNNRRDATPVPPAEVHDLVGKLLSSVRALQNKEHQLDPASCNEEVLQMQRMVSEAASRRDTLKAKYDSNAQLLAQAASLLGPDDGSDRRAELEESAKAHAAAMAEILNRLNSRVVEALAD